MTVNDLIDVPLTAQERHLLRSGLSEWGGPARCTEEFAVEMGFGSVNSLFAEGNRLMRCLDNHEPLSVVDWVRVLLANEVVFASDVVGSDTDWVATVDLTDVETIAFSEQSNARFRPRA